MSRQLIASTAAVATGHPHGAAAGLEMLRDGGNAVDAAVAAMLAMCVVVPGQVGLGGFGGSAVIRLAGGEGQGARGRQPKVVAIDFTSRAPLAFRAGSVTAEPQSSYYGARSVTVPTVVAGLDLMLREFGTRSWGEASQPAIQLAEEGFEFDAEHQRHFDRCAPYFDQQSLASLFPAGAKLKVGDRWQQPDLAWLLHTLADDGPGEFYVGEIPRRIVRYLQDRGGILTEEDFHSYSPRIADPLRISLRGFDLYTPPPPSGGVTTLAIVQTIERLLAAGSGEHGAGSIEPWGAAYFHVLAQTMRLCWQERNQHLGDPDFVSIALEKLLSDDAVRARLECIKAQSPRSSLPAPRCDPHTANVLAIDEGGSLVSITATQGWMYGSHLVVDGLGLVLNHGMSRFDYQSGHPNAPAPGKRMQHNMAPLIALRDSAAPCLSPGDSPGDKSAASATAFGMAGGPKIVTVTAQLALNAMDFGTSPAASIAAPRLHTDGREPLLVSTHTPDAVITELERLGHTTRREPDMGGPVNVLAVDPQSANIDIASGESTGAVAGL